MNKNNLSEDRSSVFAKELNWFTNTSIRHLARFLLNRVPDYFYYVPASHSGKYHPSYALGEGGLVRHTKAAMGIYHELEAAGIPLYYMQDTALGCWSESDLHDACYLALLFHDCMKLGNVQGDMKDAHTFHTHPLLAANFVEEGLHQFLLDHDFNMSDAMIVREAEKAIQSHMGKWNIARYSSVILPTPESGDWIAKLVHLCDLLASRKQIEYKFDLVDVQAS